MTHQPRYRHFPTWLLCVVLLLGAVDRSQAVPSRRGGGNSLDERVETIAGSGVEIEVTGPVDKVPPESCFFCWVTIHNRSGAARTWNLQLGNEGWRNDNNARLTTSQTLRVENDATARAGLLLALPSSDTKGYSYRSVVLRVDGYGVETASTSIASSGSGERTEPFIGMGNTLATPIWTSLQKKFSDDRKALNGAPVAPAQFSPDWRALSGFDCLWLTDGEYTALDADQRAAVRRWVAQGGILYLSARTLDPALRAELGLPETGDNATPGFGKVCWLPWDGQALDIDATEATIHRLRGLSPRAADTRDTAAWTMTRSVGAILLNAPFLLTFIGLFAVLAGPVNLFLLAPATRRHRLFWTTPLISCGASLLLILVIVFQDGFGGHGARLMVTRLFPDRKEAIVWQEQVARTGVLLSRRFTLPEDVLLTPLQLPGKGSHDYEQSGRDYGGDWFTSRLVQAQRAEAILPSRAEVQLLNPAEAESGAAPVIVSSIPATLREINYRTPAGKVWHGSNLHTGERVTLRQDGVALTVVTDGSHYLEQMQSEHWADPGTFFAVADSAPFIETLPSIRWRKQQAVYLGPVTPVR